jgi:hypothetical protein
MINGNENPVQWALLVEELNEAHEHLGKLISEMMTDTQYDDHVCVSTWATSWRT